MTGSRIWFIILLSCAISAESLREISDNGIEMKNNIIAQLFQESGGQKRINPQRKILRSQISSLPILLNGVNAYHNPGHPVDNPLVKSVSSDTGATLTPTINKYGEMEEGPVWEDAAVPEVSNFVSAQQSAGASSLFRGSNTNTAVNKISGLAVLQTNRGTTSSPLPRRTTTTAATTSTTTTTTTAAPVPEVNLPNSCVWAIISCCSASSSTINHNCFEQLGCAGSFWGGSPCESEYALAAISNAMNYYQL